MPKAGTLPLFARALIGSAAILAQFAPERGHAAAGGGAPATGRPAGRAPAQAAGAQGSAAQAKASSSEPGFDDLPKPAETPAPGSQAQPTLEPRFEQSTDAQTAATIRSSEAPPQPLASRPGEYDKPLLFMPEDNKVFLTNPQIKWDLTGGGKINLGGLVIQSDQIGMTVTQTKRDKTPRVYRPRGVEGDGPIMVSFRWPEILAKEGTVAVVSLTGQTLWKRAVQSAQRDDWKALLSRSERGALSAHFGAQWGDVDVDPAEWTFLSSGETFRVCFLRSEGRRERLAACGAPTRLARSAAGLTLAKAGKERAPGVQVNGTQIGVRGIVNFPPGQSIRIKVAFADGATIEISGEPLKLNLLDVVRTKDGRIRLRGQGPKPVGQVRNVLVPSKSFWSATGEDAKSEVIWEAIIPKDAPTVRVLGSFNVPFTYLFQYDELPSENDRVYVSSRFGGGTYVSSPRLKVFSPAGDKLASKENSAAPAGKNLTAWRFKADQAWKNNRAKIAVAKPDGTKWIAYHDLLRGLPYEASVRLTGVATPALKTVILGEAAASVWFEDLLGTDGYYFGHKRWGATFRYFQSLTSIDVCNGISLSGMRSVNADYKYNLIPGLWNRDELVGVTVSFQNVDLGGFGANLGGAGVYWARTMPKIFDDLFNLLPFMRYPKYVDMEFIAYPVAVFSDVQPGSSFNLNFHGKVFWSKTVYGEAGFGLRQYDFKSQSANRQISLGLGYGTVGLGVAF